MPFSPTLSDTPTLPEVRSALTEAGDYLNGLRTVDPDERADNWREDVRSAVDVVHLLDGLESALSAQARPVAALGQDGNEGRGGTVGSRVINDDAYVQLRDSHGADSGAATIEVRGSLGTPEYRALVDTTETDDTGGSAFLNYAPAALPPVLRQRRFFIRDLMNVQPTSLPSIPYIREGHADEADADFTTEGTAKNEAAMDWTQDDAIVRKVTAWLPMTTEAIEDAPTLRGYIDNRLSYLVAVREEEAILAGDGIAPNLKGITEFAGLQSQAFVAHPTTATNPDIVQMVALAISKIETVDGDADGVVMRPTDYWTAIAARVANTVEGGEGPYDGRPLQFSPAAAAGVPLWGLPVIRSRSVASGTAIVGAFRQGATLFDRMQTTIKVGNQHSTYFVENKVAVVAESRLALAVHRPDYFVELDLTA